MSAQQRQATGGIVYACEQRPPRWPPPSPPQSMVVAPPLSRSAHPHNVSSRQRKSRSAPQKCAHVYEW